MKLLSNIYSKRNNSIFKRYSSFILLIRNVKHIYITLFGDGLNCHSYSNTNIADIVNDVVLLILMLFIILIVNNINC